MDVATDRTVPGAIRQGERFILEATDVAQLRGGVEAIDHDHVHVVPQSFVLQKTTHPAHGCIMNAFRQLGSRKSFDVQVFDADRVMVLNELCTHLVNEVGTLASHVLLDTRHVRSCPGLVPTALLSAAEGALGTAQRACPTPIEARSGYPWPRARHHG